MRCYAFAFALALALAMTPVASHSDTIQDTDWHLLAIDGVLVDPAVTASLRIDVAGQVTGKAPCNSYGAQNSAELPAFRLGPIRATRMACDKLAEEQVYFDTLAQMETMELDGPKSLVLTGPEGRSMEFVLASVSSLPDCKTCAPTE